MNQTLPEKIFKKVTNCAACGGTRFKKWVDLGAQPIANNLVKKVGEPEHFIPLQYMVCRNCELVQTTVQVEPDIMFGDYVYYSSTSKVFQDHFKTFAQEMMNKDIVKHGDLVVDIGSNDGILLKPFKEAGVRALGIEPAKKVAEYANLQNIKTIPEYFTPELAKRILEEMGQANLITMTNVFAHVPDLKGILEGVKYLLADDGVLMIEVAYLSDMIKKGTFDLLYHEHMYAWNIYPLSSLLFKYDFFTLDIQFVETHGGSLRIFAKRGMSSGPVKWNEIGPDNYIFKEFPLKIKQKRKEIMALMRKLKKYNKRIIGYGAPAKMSTMTNYFCLGNQLIDFIIDDSPAKQGLYSPGMHIKIVPPYDNYEHCTHDYVFIFAWNFAESIMDTLKRKGYKGKFIVPFPTLQII